MGLQNEDEIWCGRAWIPRSYCSSVSGLALQLGDAISVPAQNTSTAGSMLRWVRNFGLDFVLSAGTRRDSGGLVAVGFIDIDTRNVAVFFFSGREDSLHRQEYVGSAGVPVEFYGFFGAYDHGTLWGKAMLLDRTHHARQGGNRRNHLLVT